MTTEQEVFDQVVAHLRKQNSKSVAYNDDGSVQMIFDGPVCVYRSKDGKKCAAGAAITDEEYCPEMEGLNIGGVIENYNLKRLQPHLNVLRYLQYIHDRFPVDQWEDMFKEMATRYNLVYTPPAS